MACLYRLLIPFKSAFSSVRTVENSFFTCAIHKSHKVLRRKPIRIVKSYDNKKKVSALALNEVKAVTPFQKHTVVNVKTGEALVSSGVMKNYVAFPPYEKLKESDEKFTAILTTLKSHTLRDLSGKVLLEGVRLINDAINAGIKMEMLFFSQEETLAKIDLHKALDAKLYKVLYKTLQVWSSVKTCPGIMGVFVKPTANDLSVMTDTALPVTVIGHNIRDHRIMGSIIRNAACVGCQSLLFTEDCEDVWKANVLRSGGGAHFRLPIVDKIPWTHLSNYISQDCTIYLVDSVKNANEDIYIDYSEELIANDEPWKSAEGSDDYMFVNEKFNDEEHLKNFEPGILSELRYSDVCFPKKDIVLCVSENEFADDPRAIKLAYEFGGNRLKVPVVNNIELGTSVTLPVILYEIRRQIEEEYVA